MQNDLIVYQGENGEIAFKGDLQHGTIWASQSQIASLFGVERSVVTKHIKNIFADNELDKDKVCTRFTNITTHGAISNRSQKNDVVCYNLDIILAVGYRIKTSEAIAFRQWVTKTLHQHIIKGYTINKKSLAQNYKEFLRAVETVKKLTPEDYGQVKTQDPLELVKMFANTWLSLVAYDKSTLPKTGTNKKQIKISAKHLQEVIVQLKVYLIEKGEASELFAQERQNNALSSIFGNVFQTAFGQDVYGTLEEKAAHLLYFIVKTHPFVDGNKRSGAFAFIWFLQKAKLLRYDKLTPEALTALTLLIAESKTEDKDKMIGIILQLLKNDSSILV